jgi:hypothetical protein
VHIAGDKNATHGPTPEVMAAWGEFFSLHLAAGPVPVKDTYLCINNPTDKDCGRIAYKLGAGGCCPHCQGPIKPMIGLEALAQGEGLSWPTGKRASAEYGIESGRKGFGPGGFFYWRLPDGHPDLDPLAPTTII